MRKFSSEFLNTVGVLAVIGVGIGLACFTPPKAEGQAVNRTYPYLGSPSFVETEATGYSVDQNLKSATTSLRLLSFGVLETGGGIGYGALRATPGGAGACTGKVYAYFYTPANGAYNYQFETGGVDASTGVCIDRLAGTWSVSLHTATAP